MSVGNKLPLSQAQNLADKLIKTLEPACDRIMVAGSIRRQKTMIGDIELVCIPRIDVVSGPQIDLFGEVTGQKTTITHHLDLKLSEMLKLSPDRHPIFRSLADMSEAFNRYGRPAPVREGADVKRWGERYKRFYVWFNDEIGAVAVDLFITTRENWGAILAIRTGPDDFNQTLMAHIRYKTGFLQEDGYLVRKSDKKAIAVPTEVEYFQAIGAPFFKPEERTADRLRAILAAKAKNSAKSGTR